MGATDPDRPVVTPAAELLVRLSVTMKSVIAPSTTGTAKPQAYMAAVVLEKVAKQMELAPAHAARQAEDAAALVRDLRAATAASALPDATRASLAALESGCNEMTLCLLVRALYSDRPLLGDDLFAALLGRVRVTLRADIDRRMEFSA